MPNAGEVVLLVGTMKGGFILSAGPDRTDWQVNGPHFPGEAVYSSLLDQRGGRSRLFMSGQSMHWGSTIRVSDDLGAGLDRDDRRSGERRLTRQEPAR